MNNSKFSSLLLKGILIVVAFIAVVVTFLMTFSVKNRNNYIRLVREELCSTMKETSSKFSARLKEGELNQGRLEGLIEAGVLDKSNIVDELSALAEEAGARNVVFVTPDLHAIDNEGKELDYIYSAYKYIFENKEAAFYFLKNDGITGFPAYTYCNPVYDGSTLKGYVVEYIAADALLEILYNNDYYNYSFYILLDEDNNTLNAEGRSLSSSFLEGEPLEKFEAYASDDVTTWHQYMENCVNGDEIRVFRVDNGNDCRYLVCSKIAESGMKLMVAIDDYYYNARLNELNAVAKSFEIQFICSLVFMLIGCAIIMILMRIHTRESSKALEDKAETDLLTGLCNKLATEAKIAEYIRENPDGQGVLLLIDVDNFKKINDTQGHIFGDEVLRTLGMRLRSLYRASDIVGRIGGDEFIIFLKDVKDMSIVIRESRKLESFFKNFEVGEYVKYAVTASLGAAIFSMDGDNFEELYKNADQALYDAKHKGKKQLMFYKQSEKDFLNKQN